MPTDLRSPRAKGGVRPVRRRRPKRFIDSAIDDDDRDDPLIGAVDDEKPAPTQGKSRGSGLDE